MLNQTSNSSAVQKIDVSNIRRTKQDYQEIQIEKIVVSSNLSGLALKDIQRVKQHLQQLLGGLIPSLKKRPFTYTKIKKPNALWKTRRKSAAGLKVTVRSRSEIYSVVDFLQKFDYQTFSLVNTKTLAYGLKQHRFLRLEKFSYAAPDYGLSFFIVFKKPGNRVSKRRFNKQPLIYDFKKEDCVEALNKLIVKTIRKH